MKSGLRFAGSSPDYKDSEFVIVGVPFDKTSSFRAGTSEGPEYIRKSSYCFEPYLMEYEISLNDLNIHDTGDLDVEGSDGPEGMGKKVKEKTRDLLEDEKSPIFVGGEHSVTPYLVDAFHQKYPDLKVIIIDAHLDYRDEYEGMKRSHATCSRRVSDIVGLKNLSVIGVRSISIDESKERELPEFHTSFDILEDETTIDGIAKELSHPVYLSIDMDGIDPSYAPGVGNPEPFGLEPIDVKKLISNSSDKIVGFDIMETNPKYDSSEITSNLGARFVYEYIGSKKKK